MSTTSRTEFPPREYYELREIVERFNRAWTPAPERWRKGSRPAFADHDATDPAFRRIVRMERHRDSSR